MDARWPRRLAPGGLVTSGCLDNGSQVGVYVSPLGGVIRWPGYMSPSEGNYRIIWRSRCIFKH